MSYLALKHFHVTLAIVSVVLFIARAGASIYRSKKPAPLFRAVTHLVDVLLLGIGVTLAYMLSISPFNTPWFAAKLLAVVAYIICGTVVMKGSKRQAKALAMVLSVALLAYIVTTALTKDVVGFLHYL